MYARLLRLPTRSAFLFGPRGTGKSTWIRSQFSSGLEVKPIIYDLLSTKEHLRLTHNPDLFYQELRDAQPGSWVVVDEIQRVPRLLDEVHRLMEERKLKFLLTGSSARRLKKESVNLLAGRAIKLELFPMVSRELGRDFKLRDALRYGTLPVVLGHEDRDAVLSSYAEVYLDQEIRTEAFVKDLGGFSRFLEIAARSNGQVTNLSNIAKDAEVHRITVAGYFDVLVDTLVGTWLPAWRLKKKNKQVIHPKFYFFDPGVVRALSGRIAFPSLPEEEGFLLETILLGEIRAFLSYHGKKYPMAFWKSHQSSSEVDLIIETPKGYVAIEIKASRRWEHRFENGLRQIRGEMKGKILETYGVFLGERVLTTSERIPVYPAERFLEKLWDSKIIA